MAARLCQVTAEYDALMDRDDRNAIQVAEQANYLRRARKGQALSQLGSRV